MKKYSIVLISYQRKIHIKNTLEALNHLKGFSREDYEVILVDDGSSDGTAEYIKGVDRNYDFKYVFLERSPQSCMARARNHGYKIAGGEIVAFIDSDIIVKDDYLLELDRCYSLEKDLMVAGTRWMLPENVPYESVQDGSVFTRYHLDMNNPDIADFRCLMLNRLSYNIYSIPHPWFWVFGFSMALPKSWLERYGGFDEYYKGTGQEDTDLALKMYLNGIKIALNRKLEVLHQYHDQNPNSELYEKNTRYFLDKYPEVFGDCYQQAFDFFTYKPSDFITGGVRGEPLPRRVLELKDRDSLPKLKETILTLSGRRGIELVVVDRIEDTDLDIWIQLLGRKNCTPKYYPASLLK